MRYVERLIVKRVRTSLDRQVWLTRLAFMQLVWKELLAVTAGLTLAGVVLLLVPLGAPTPRHVMAGVLFASAFWIPSLVIAMRTYTLTVGSWAEGWTREVLRSRKLGWTVVEDLVLGAGNIDHVAVTQDVVLVVETKYRSASQNPDQGRHDRDVTQTRQAAARVGKDLHARGLDVARVVPLLVVWGPGGRDLPRLRTTTDVHVVAGSDLDAWCRRRSAKQLVSLRDRKAIAQALSDRRREHDTWRARYASAKEVARP